MHMSILHTYVSTQRPEEDGGAGVSEGCAWPFWVLAIKSESSARAASTSNSWATSPAP